ncbi:hypothetical protein HO173_008130 [Letharia columbiana]|uniref:Uncharacterized protein n=1 Tax=Letharia columbiana TaxID=112416 RepID=A0A8H6FRX9_9LECA|nr:uncharacterized protein HO173_008130 [Letharia columbiana]KAF6233573.1 hypothetical protein HO173_008130 [Letharia columbiana]
MDASGSKSLKKSQHAYIDCLPTFDNVQLDHSITRNFGKTYTALPIIMIRASRMQKVFKTKNEVIRRFFGLRKEIAMIVSESNDGAPDGNTVVMDEYLHSISLSSSKIPARAANQQPEQDQFCSTQPRDYIAEKGRYQTRGTFSRSIGHLLGLPGSAFGLSIWPLPSLHGQRNNCRPHNPSEKREAPTS